MTSRIGKNLLWLQFLLVLFFQMLIFNTLIRFKRKWHCSLFAEKSAFFIFLLK